MNVLLLGSGGREHALAAKLNESPDLKNLYCAPGSDAIAEIAKIARVDPLDPKAVVAFARENKIDLLVIGPEAPLAAGVSDAARAAGILTFGPSRAAAELETSKAFAKDFMKRHKIPTADFAVCSSAAEAAAAAKEYAGRCAIKADGLAAGKGVIVCSNTAESDAAAKSLSALPGGKRLIVEEKLSGPELTVMAIVGGGTHRLLPLSRDHKRLNDDDKGPNTGGMGAVAPVEISDGDARKINAIMRQVTGGLRADQLDYRGVIYVGVMMTANGPKVLEFNARFGDPEAQTILPLIKSDLLKIMRDVAAGEIPLDIEAAAGAAVAITLSSPGYPEAPAAGTEIELPSAAEKDVRIYHAGTKKTATGWTATGGRVLTVVGLGADVAAARERAYAAVTRLKIGNLHYRRDIAASVPLKANQ